MKNKTDFIQKYLLWSKERFPATGVILYSGCIFYLSYFFGKLFHNQVPMSFIKTLPGFFVIFLVLLHIRVFDEHKDYDKDVIAYPERILSKGIITLSDLRVLLYITVFLEIIVSLSFGPVQTIVWLMIMGWSLLMLFEFFVPEFLNRHMGLYLISHQMLLPIVLLFGFSMRYDLNSIRWGDITTIVIFMAGTMFATVTYEIARKTWSKDREHEHADSYTKFWGIGKAVFINQVVAFLSGVCFSVIYALYDLHKVFNINIGILYILFLFTGVIFFRSPTNKNSKMLELGGTLFLLGVFVNSIIAFGVFG